MGWIIAVIICVAVFTYLKMVSELRKECDDLYSARRLLNEAIRLRRIPAINSDIFLKPGEEVFYSGAARLHEIRAASRRNNVFVGGRATKNIFVGGSTGVSRPFDELREIDSGMVTLTNKRIVFDGAYGTRSEEVNKLISAKKVGKSGLEIGIEGKQKSQIYQNIGNLWMLHSLINIVRGLHLYSSENSLSDAQIGELQSMESEMGRLEKEARDKLALMCFAKKPALQVQACSSCGQMLRFPNKPVTVTCPNCGFSFRYSP